MGEDILPMSSPLSNYGFIISIVHKDVITDE